MSKEEGLAYLNSLSPAERLSYASGFIKGVKSMMQAIEEALNEEFRVNLIIVAKNASPGHGMVITDDHTTADELIAIINRMLRPFEQGETPEGVTIGRMADPTEIN